LFCHLKIIWCLNLSWCWHHNLQQVKHVSPKRKGRCFLYVEIHNVGCRDSIRIVEIFLRQKEGYYKYYFYIYILIDTKLYYLSSMDLKGLYLSWFPLKEPTGCLMKMATHISIIEIPQVQSWHHHMFPFKNLSKI